MSRIVVLDHTAELGGAELALLRLVEAMTAPDREQVTVLLLADGPLRRRLADAGVSVEVIAFDAAVAATSREAALRPLRLLPSVVHSLRAATAVARRLRQLDAGLLHTTSLKADLIGAVAARMARVPLVWHVHDRIAEDYLPAPLVVLLRGLARRVPDRVIVNSRAVAATLPGARLLTVVYPGLSPEQIRAAPRPRPARPVVTVLGRISETKGQLDVVRALPEVLAVVPDARLRLVGAAAFGQDAYEQEVRRTAQRLGVADRVELVGFVDDPGPELERASVLVHVATTPEPFGQVVAEAMAYGVPVVTTGRGGTGEIVAATAAEPLAVLVPAGERGALAAALVQVLTDPEAAAARAARAYDVVRERFTVATTEQRVRQVWMSILSTRSGA